MPNHTGHVDPDVEREAEDARIAAGVRFHDTIEQQARRRDELNMAALWWERIGRAA